MTLSRRRLLTLTAALGAGPAALAGCASTEPDQLRRITDPDDFSFPRSGTYFLAQEDLPSVQTLACYDAVVIDSEWQHRKPRTFFDDLRRRNPRLTLLAYVNLVDSMPETGSPDYYANAYSLWRFTDSETSTFPREWLAYTADGKAVHEYSDRIMTNLTDVAPKVDGQIFAEYAAHWVVDEVWSTGLWDGIFLDVWADQIYGADSDRWDIDGDGTDETEAEIYGPGGPLDRGLSIAEQIMRSLMPTAVLLANGERHLHGQTLNGLVAESFADPEGDRGETSAEALAGYVEPLTSDQVAEPARSMTIDLRRTLLPRSAQALRKARFYLCATLLQNGWWVPMGRDYADPAYYDELDGGGLGRGYLGRALTAEPTLELLNRRPDDAATDGTGSPAPGVYRRDFTHGIALVNTGTEAQRIELGTRFRHLRGDQDPTVNDGSVVNSVMLAGEDGVILLRTSG